MRTQPAKTFHSRARRHRLAAACGTGADRAAFIATLSITAKLNDIDPQAWLADVLARIADHPVSKIDELRNWKAKNAAIAAAA
ncbi:hypothetical protein AJ87_26430 [Rhizobium yanglingense]|nr:hypothetical protein AJ87_26430 [Rhizobium yanglingense]